MLSKLQHAIFPISIGALYDVHLPDIFSTKDWLTFVFFLIFHLIISFSCVYSWFCHYTLFIQNDIHAILQKYLVEGIFLIIALNLWIKQIKKKIAFKTSHKLWTKQSFRIFAIEY